MSVYVGFKKGKVHEEHIISEYYCAGCGWPVTDHDSYCPECGGAFQESFATEHTCKLTHVRSGDDYYVFKCSNCGHEVGLHDINPEKCSFHYCDNCGAKVVKE